METKRDSENAREKPREGEGRRKEWEREWGMSTRVKLFSSNMSG